MSHKSLLWEEVGKPGIFEVSCTPSPRVGTKLRHAAVPKQALDLFRKPFPISSYLRRLPVTRDSDGDPEEMVGFLQRFEQTKPDPFVITFHRPDSAESGVWCVCVPVFLN